MILHAGAAGTVIANYNSTSIEYVDIDLFNDDGTVADLTPAPKRQRKYIVSVDDSLSFRETATQEAMRIEAADRVCAGIRMTLEMLGASSPPDERYAEEYLEAREAAFTALLKAGRFVEGPDTHEIYTQHFENISSEEV